MWLSNAIIVCKDVIDDDLKILLEGNLVELWQHIDKHVNFVNTHSIRKIITEWELVDESEYFRN